jgi:hypothetical protein
MRTMTLVGHSERWRIMRRRPRSSKAMARAKLAELDAQVERLHRARTIIEWGLTCTCPTLDDCTCGVHLR